MGVDKGIYIGVYIEAPDYKIKKDRKIFRKPSGKISKTRFNPETGEEYKEDTIVETVTVYPSSYIEDNDELEEDMFFTPEYTSIRSFLLNTNDTKFTIDYNYDCEIFNAEINDINIPTLIEEFKKEYAEYLNYYKNKYPKTDIKVKFGVVAYAN